MRNRLGDATPQVLVLGAVAAGAGTVADVQKRLRAMWPGGGYARNAAHTNLKSLVRLRQVRVVEAAEPDSETFYEITDAGRARIREYVGSPPPDPAVRDPIHVRTAFAKLNELPMLVEMTRADQQHCRELSDAAQAKLLSQERLRQKVAPRDWAEALSEELDLARLKDETLFWGDFAARRETYGDAVEDIYARFSKMARQDPADER